MDQIRRLLASLTLRQKIMIATAAIAVFGGIFYFIRYRQEKDFVPLFAGLEHEDAATVVTRLKEGATEYRLADDGKTVKVRSAQVPDIRLRMAEAGIPKTGRIGFEIFDKTNFGETEFVEKIKYNRAIEGELERSVKTISAVETARVHITPPVESVFADQRRPAKASVLLKLREGEQLTPRNLKGMTHLVASAVAGLQPEQVSVVDEKGNLLTRPNVAGTASEEVLNSPLLEYRRNLERDLVAKINATLEPILGPNRFRAAVSVDLDLGTLDQSEESFDPNRSVMTTSQRSEDTAVASAPAGIPGTPTNLPRPAPRPGANGQNLQRRTENINYQTSRLVRHQQTPQGAIRKISASVLLDHLLETQVVGNAVRKVVVAPTAERIKSTRDIVAGVIGLQTDRGDQVVVDSIPFESTLQQATPPPLPPLPPQPAGQTVVAQKGAPAAQAPAFNPVQWVRDGIEKKDKVVLGVLGGTALLLILGVLGFVFRKKLVNKVPVLRRRAAAKAARSNPAIAEASAGSTAALPSAEDTGPDFPALPEPPPGGAGSDVLEKQLQAHLAARHREKKEQEVAILTELTANVKLPSNATKKAEVLAKHLSEEVKRNPEAIAHIARTWVNERD